MSKGLEKLQENNVLYHKYTIHQVYGEILKADNVEKQINENNNAIENELKALEIVKKFAKSIDLKYFFCDNLIILIIGGDDFEWQYKCSSQDEYDLLKEALEK